MPLMKRFAASLIIFALILATAAGQCACAEPRRYSYTFLGAFDTATTITAYCKNERDFVTLRTKVEEEMLKYHRYFDIYNEYDGTINLKSINDNAGKGALTVEDEIFDLLTFGKTAYDLSGGRLNIMLGAVLRLWHGAREAGISSPDTAALPDTDALREAAEHCDIDNLEINQVAKTVEISDPQASIDVGAIAKGFAVSRVCETLSTLGYSNVLINSGGNIGTVGAKPDGENWLAAVQNPEAFDENSQDEVSDIAYKELNGQALATSGDYQRYYIVAGRRYHHLIDPSTLYPAEYARSVTVFAENAAIADALSTALFMMTPEDAIAFAEASNVGIEAFIVTRDGRTFATSGW